MTEDNDTGDEMTEDRLRRIVERMEAENRANDPMRQYLRPGMDLLDRLTQEVGMENVQFVLISALGTFLALNAWDADADLERRLTLACRLVRARARADELTLRLSDIKQADVERRRRGIRLVRGEEDQR